MTDKTADIVYRLRLKAAPEDVFNFLATDTGRSAFWAERTEQRGNEITFYFPNDETLLSRVLDSRPPRLFSVTYFNNSTVTFDLKEQAEGTILRLRETGVPDSDQCENRAGWVSVLLNLKARVDHGIDLRNHDPQYTWSDGYVDN